MAPNLEDIASGNHPPQFKSRGEQKIANFLDKNLINYQYESPVVVNAQYNKPRIWYPDFYLQEFKTYIEYYGMAGNRQYDQGIKVKESTYSKSGIDVIPVYPWMFKENWEGYIMQEIKRNSIKQYENLMSKPYWSRNSPTFNSYRPTGSYRHSRSNRY